MDDLVRTQRRIIVGLFVLAALLVALGCETPHWDSQLIVIVVGAAMAPGLLTMTRRRSLGWMAWAATLLTMFFGARANQAAPHAPSWTYAPIAFTVIAMFVGFLWLTTTCHHAATLRATLPDVPEARVRR